MVSMVGDDIASVGFANGATESRNDAETSKSDDKVARLQYSVPGVLHYLQHEWVKYEQEKTQWEVERAELMIAFLQGERKGQENLKNDLVRRVKMLEFALRQERAKYYRLLHGEEASEKEEPPSGERASVKDEVPCDFDSVPANQTRTGACWRQGRLLLKQYLEEIGYTDTILDVKRHRLRSLLGLNAVDPSNAEKSMNKLAELLNLGPSASLSDLNSAYSQKESGNGGDGAHPRVLKAGEASVQELGTAKPERPDSDFSNAVEEALNEFAFLPGTDVPDSSSKTASTDWTNVDYQVLDKKKADFQRELQQKKGVSRRVPRAELEAMITSLNVTDEGSSASVSVADKESEVVARLLSKDSKFVQDLDAALGSVGGFSDLMAMTGPFDDAETANRGVIRPQEESLRKTWTVRFTLRCHFDCVRAIAFHPVEAIVLSASEDATVKLWNLQKSLTTNSAGATGVGAGNSRKGSQDFDPVYTFHGHSGPVLCMCLSPTGDYCYTGGLDKTVRCWMMPPPNIDPYDPLDRSISSEVLRGHDDAVWSLAFHSSDNRLISASADGTLKLWEPSASSPLLATYVADPDDGSPTSVDFMSSDLHHAVAAYSSGAAYIYDLEQAKTVLRFPPASGNGGFLRSSTSMSWRMCSEHFSAAYSLSPINQIVCHPTLPITVTAHEDRTIRFFDNNSGQMIDCVVAHLDAVTCLSIDPNGLFLLSGKEDEMAKILDTLKHLSTSDECNKTDIDTWLACDKEDAGFHILNDDETVYALSTRRPSSAWKLLYNGSKCKMSHDGSLRLWNIDSKTCLQETTAHRKKFDESLFSVAFHPSRPIIASAGADGLAKIFMLQCFLHEAVVLENVFIAIVLNSKLSAALLESLCLFVPDNTGQYCFCAIILGNNAFPLAGSVDCAKMLLGNRRFPNASFSDVSLIVDVAGERRRLIYRFLTNIRFIALLTTSVFEEGDDIVRYFEEPCLVIVNHQSTADVPILVHVINALSGYCYKVYMISFSVFVLAFHFAQVMWVLDLMFRWTPFGLICQLHGDLFIRECMKAQGKESQRYGLGDLRAQLMRKFWPRRRRWIVVFPEGGFLRKRLESSQRYARKNGYPVFNYVVLPRTGAMQVVLETCAPSPEGNHVVKDTNVEHKQQRLRYIIDVTIAYEKDATFGLWEICTGTMTSKKVVLRYRCHDISEISDHSKEGILDYLCKLWSEKEEWLKAMAEEEGNSISRDKVASRRRVVIPVECLLFSHGTMFLLSLTCAIVLGFVNLRWLSAAGCTFLLLRSVHNRWCSIPEYDSTTEYETNEKRNDMLTQ
ncbi:hypothetical protein M513_00213, partial [Trichuris suis]